MPLNRRQIASKLHTADETFKRALPVVDQHSAVLISLQTRLVALEKIQQDHIAQSFVNRLLWLMMGAR